MHARQRRANDEIMSNDNDPEMHDEYDFSKGRRGHYAKRYAEGTNVVLLDPDVAAYFRDSAHVNQALRWLLLRALAARSRRGDTSVRTLREEYGDDFLPGFRADTTLAAVLETTQAESLAELLAALEAGHADTVAGRTKPLTDEALRDIAARARSGTPED